MAEDVSPRAMALIRLITMIFGQAASLFMMYEYGAFRLEPGAPRFPLNLAFAGVASGCFIYMLLQIRVLRRLKGARAAL